MQIIDLSVAVNERTPVYPGDPSAKLEPGGQLDTDGFVDHIVTLGTHVGTHIDAPLHMLEGGKTLDQFPISRFVGPGRYVDARKGFSIQTLQEAGIKAGDIVLFHTGMSDHFHDPIYYDEYPAMSDEIAQYLVTAKVRMVGLDTGSADNRDGFPIHKTLLGGGVLIIENLTYLAPLRGHDFTVYALPIKFELDAAPARVIAEIT
jgi:arylformamidase